MGERRVASLPPDVPTKEEAERQTASHVNRLLLYCLENKQDVFYRLGREVIPGVDRAFVEAQARLLEENGVREFDIRYVPDYRFGRDCGEFSDRMYLQFLYDRQTLERGVMRQWIKKFGIEMYHQKILYGCILEEFRERKRKRGDK